MGGYICIMTAAVRQLTIETLWLLQKAVVADILEGISDCDISLRHGISESAVEKIRVSKMLEEQRGAGPHGLQ